VPVRPCFNTLGADPDFDHFFIFMNVFVAVVVYLVSVVGLVSVCKQKGMAQSGMYNLH
jgi:hypothetical protein